MKRRRTLLREILRWSMIIVFLVWILAPILWMVGTSLKTPAEQFDGHLRLFPENPAWDNYKKIWNTIPLARYFMNSLLISLITVIVCITIASFASYALSKFRFRGREVFGIAALFTQLMPGVLFLLPIYIMMVMFQQKSGIQMTGTYKAVVLTYATFGIPFSIWMMRSYFDTIPGELSEAGLVDGCSRIQTFFRIILPLAAPGIAATAMYVFIVAWNEVLFATVLTNETTRTFAIGLREFEKQYTKDYGQLMAASIVVSAPIVILFMAFQRLIVSGLTGGGVKE